MNIANFIKQNSSSLGGKQAVLMRRSAPFWGLGFAKAKFDSCSFDELEKRSNLYANAFKKAGIEKGTKALIFVTPSLEFHSLIFAIFKVGAVPVFIDPGMGVDNMLECIQGVEASALIGIPKIHYLMKVKRSYFKSVKIAINTEGSFLGTHSLKKLAKDASNQFEIEEMVDTELGAILFTSGGTGRPKGVEYTHQMFWDQVLRLKEGLRLTQEDKDYPGFPLFSLFTLALGLTTHIPEIDASKPADCNPKKVVRDLIEENITFAAGSPSIWKNVANYCLKKRIAVTKVRKLALFGAPVSYKLLEKLEKVFPMAQIYTPYGATECLPISFISSYEVLRETKDYTTKGKGVCVGFPMRGVEVKVIRLKEELEECEVGEVGEIIVYSSTATPGYHLQKEATESIHLNYEGKRWHRMGDLGSLDKWGRVWFFGRKAHYITWEEENFYPVAVEGIFNEHPEVERSALINFEGEAALAIERKDKRDSLSIEFQEKFFSELELLGGKFEETEKIKRFILFDSFPVDTRHNIKIDRIKLGSLAKEKLGLDL